MAIEKLDNVSVAFIDKSVEIFLSKDTPLTKSDLAKALKGLKVDVLDVTRADSVQLWN